jgi:hypothetical protein
MVGLAPHRRFPAQAEPGEVVEQGGLELRPAAGDVDVLHAQEEAAAGLGGERAVGHGGIGVAEMEVAVRRGREADDRLGEGRGHANPANMNDRPQAFGAMDAMP